MNTTSKAVENPKGCFTNKIKIAGSEALLASLIEEGVDTIFGYPGGAIMPVYDSLYDFADKLNHILVRHEQGAVHAAQGYARITKRTGVCLATSGPGATNLITGIADAQIDSTPIVCITGQVASHLLGTDAFQETDVIGVSMPVTKWNYQITSAAEIPDILAKAFYIANSGRPGPVLIDITKDAQLDTFEFKYKKYSKIRSYTPFPALNIDAIDQAAKMINEAKKPLLLAGHGVLISRAEKELKDFVEKTGIPTASTLLGLSAFPTNHELNVGYLGMHGNYGPNVKTNECDLLVAVGMRFDDRVTGSLNTYAKQAKVIHIEIDSAEINKNVYAHIPIEADAKKALSTLIPKVDKKTYPEWLSEFRECDRIEHEKIVQHELYPKSGEIRMGEVIRIISELTNGEAVIVSDVGQHQMVVSRYYKWKVSNTHITSGGLGTMGFCLPAAMGAKIGAQDKQVIAVIGDGGYQMTLQEMATIMQYDIGIKIVVLNNSFLGMVRQWQQLFFDKRYSFTEMVNPNFIKISEGFNIPAKKVTEREQLRSSIDDMLKRKGSFFMEVIVGKEENVFPMIPTGASVSDILLE